MFRILCFLMIISIKTILTAGDSKFVIMICSYNNEKWVEKNLLSALNQNYNNFRVIYINDCSTDGTLSRLDCVIRNHPKKNILQIVNNESNKGAMTNIYNTIHSYIKDDEIVCLLDGDDWLANNYVLSVLDMVYKIKRKKYWLVYSQFQGTASNSEGFCKAYSDRAIRSNQFRSEGFLCSHLKTFYGWLFKKIKKEDLQRDGDFLEITSDIGFMMPMIEMAKNHQIFIPKVLYIYNQDNPISDLHQRGAESGKMAEYLLSLPPYSSLD